MNKKKAEKQEIQVNIENQNKKIKMSIMDGWIMFGLKLDIRDRFSNFKVQGALVIMIIKGHFIF